MTGFLLGFYLGGLIVVIRLLEVITRPERQDIADAICRCAQAFWVDLRRDFWRRLIRSWGEYLCIALALGALPLILIPLSMVTATY